MLWWWPSIHYNRYCYKVQLKCYFNQILSHRLPTWGSPAPTWPRTSVWRPRTTWCSPCSAARTPARGTSPASPAGTPPSASTASRTSGGSSCQTSRDVSAVKVLVDWILSHQGTFLQLQRRGIIVKFQANQMFIINLFSILYNRQQPNC